MPFKNSPNLGIMALEERTHLKLRTRLLLNVGGVILAAVLIIPIWGEKLKKLAHKIIVFYSIAALTKKAGNRKSG
jgi:hypothetical protein